jgi:hypothetical protein
VTSPAAAGRPARTLSDTRQRFPQWRISPSAEGWLAVPRATWTIDASTLDGLYERLEREEARREAAPHGVGSDSRGQEAVDADSQ